MTIRVQQETFDIGAETTAFLAQDATRAGGMVTFTGLVRDEGGSLSGMEIEHYPGMTESALAEIEAEEMRRWHLIGSLIIQRYATLGPGVAIMMVATAALHRAEAFAAAEFLMDYTALTATRNSWCVTTLKLSDTWLRKNLRIAPAKPSRTSGNPSAARCRTTSGS